MIACDPIRNGFFITNRNPPCPPVPLAASPCPSAIGFASGHCRVAWLAGELAWQAGQTASSKNLNTPEAS